MPPLFCGGYGDGYRHGEVILGDRPALRVDLTGKDHRLQIDPFGLGDSQDAVCIGGILDDRGAAIIGNALIFTSLHVFNPGFTVIAGTQIFLVGIVFSLLVYYYDSLWAAITFHTAWNYTQNLIFGLPNSGIVSAE